jgi:hypothetical protein
MTYSQLPRSASTLPVRRCRLAMRMVGREKAIVLPCFLTEPLEIGPRCLSCAETRPVVLFREWNSFESQGFRSSSGDV